MDILRAIAIAVPDLDGKVIIGRMRNCTVHAVTPSGMQFNPDHADRRAVTYAGIRRIGRIARDVDRKMMGIG